MNARHMWFIRVGVWRVVYLPVKWQGVAIAAAATLAIVLSGAGLAWIFTRVGLGEGAFLGYVITFLAGSVWYQFFAAAHSDCDFNE